MKQYDVIVIGDANVDLVVAGCSDMPGPGQEVFVRNITLHVGGGAALFSLSLARLGLRTAFNGVLGDDGFGQFVKERFNQSGIDTRFIRTSNRNNTGISIAINPEKDRSFISYMGSNAELDLQQLDMRSVVLGRHVHLTGYRGSRNHAEYMDMTRRIKALGLTVSIDVGWDDTGEWYKGVFELMEEVNVFFMNEVEAQHYTGCSSAEACLKTLSAHSRHTVLKLGAMGAAAAVDGRMLYRSGFEVPVVDTTGAGDAFNAGYMYGFLTGQPPEQCLLYANACGAMSVSQFGGSPEALNHAAMEQFIAEKAGRTTDHWQIAQ
ncbi:carbohydrate kinase family protein [Paenibacillus sp. R14(2021)]|uniref:carbohydrate kinase family protein n=1 Tax=Paenibacillus sp. R14(2021) TaxID=2859228 RepID=UPI001C615532|nr:carbohydrate kinase family protein [Paenibacillus sp. R14(2021)]